MPTSRGQSQAESMRRWYLLPLLEKSAADLEGGEAVSQKRELVGRQQQAGGQEAEETLQRKASGRKVVQAWERELQTCTERS